MYCFSCSKRLSDKEAAIKFEHHEEIKNPEDRYVNLCTSCLRESDLAIYAPEPDPSFEVDEDVVLLGSIYGDHDETL